MVCLAQMRSSIAYTGCQGASSARHDPRKYSQKKCPAVVTTMTGRMEAGPLSWSSAILKNDVTWLLVRGLVVQKYQARMVKRAERNNNPWMLLTTVVFQVLLEGD
ncbi:hypothetical protein ONS95_000105 [Cadophora gregata]|uniref:uncharacterized protein n=1 Tax=Cadophora gregata TaxID=51156 RepID=UPI0026DD33BA|nr:uncharacterized protein ONS95_000105 [Cadophora gregata]KAK0115626.1 hypothetical protein ONS96_014072 [Cadophora gregata f. sp. sojae]KAK0128121.1 hypothetical protein ONS95_000105 [Cadophora gregata]